MKRLAALAFVLTCFLVSSCGDDSPEGPPNVSWLRVYVHWEAQGLAGKRIEVPELGRESLTDSTGIATFEVPVGRYTVRAYEINTPGPPPAYVERSVTTSRGEVTNVDIVDCLPCVGPQ